MPQWPLRPQSYCLQFHELRCRNNIVDHVCNTWERVCNTVDHVCNTVDHVCNAVNHVCNALDHVCNTVDHVCNAVQHRMSGTGCLPAFAARHNAAREKKQALVGGTRTRKGTHMQQQIAWLPAH